MVFFVFFIFLPSILAAIILLPIIYVRKKKENTQMVELYGICGTNGSGKDTVGVMLEERYDFLFVSVSDFLREECQKRGLPVERENLRMISSEWRREYGLGILVDKALEKFKDSKKKYKGVAAVPMRNVGEAERIHELGGKLVWVDANPKVRYKRISSRKRGDEDNKTYEEFLKEESDEMHDNGDKAALNIAGVKKICDIFIENSGDDIEQFKLKAEKALGLKNGK